MKKLLLTLTLGILFTGFTSFAATEIEKAIMDSRPETLEALLEKESLTGPQKKSYFILGMELYQMKKSEASYSLRENPKPGEIWIGIGMAPLMGGLSLALLTFCEKMTHSDKLTIRTPNNVLTSTPFFISHR